MRGSKVLKFALSIVRGSRYNHPTMTLPHELILLSPYKLPGQYPLTLAEDEMASWLNGYSALWHPSVLWNATQPPSMRIRS